MPTQAYVQVPVWRIRLVIGCLAAFVAFLTYLLLYQALWLLALCINRCTVARARSDGSQSFTILIPLTPKWTSHVELVATRPRFRFPFRLTVSELRARIVYDLASLADAKLSAPHTAPPERPYCRRPWPKHSKLLAAGAKTLILCLLDRLKASVTIEECSLELLIWVRRAQNAIPDTHEPATQSQGSLPVLFDIRRDDDLERNLQLFTRPAHYRFCATSLRLAFGRSAAALSVVSGRLTFGRISSVILPPKTSVTCSLDPLSWVAKTLGDICSPVTSIRVEWWESLRADVEAHDIFRELIVIYHRVQLTRQQARRGAAKSDSPAIPLDVIVLGGGGIHLNVEERGSAYSLYATCTEAKLDVTLCEPLRPGEPTKNDDEIVWDCLTDCVKEVHRSTWFVTLGNLKLHSRSQSHWNWWKTVATSDMTSNDTDINTNGSTQGSLNAKPGKCIAHARESIQISVVYERIPPRERARLPACLTNASYRQRSSIILESVDCLIGPGDVYHWWQLFALGRKLHRFCRHHVSDPESFDRTREQDVRVTNEAHIREAFNLNSWPEDWWTCVPSARDQSVKYLRGIGEYWDFYAAQQRDVLVLEVRGTIRALTSNLETVDVNRHPSRAQHMQLMASEGLILVSTTTLMQNYFNGTILHLPTLSVHSVPTTSLDELRPLVIDEPVASIKGVSYIMPSKADRTTLLLDVFEMGRPHEEQDELALDIMDLVNVYNMILLSGNSALYWKKSSELARLFNPGNSLPQNFLFCVGVLRLLCDDLTLHVCDVSLLRDYSGLSNEGMLASCSLIRLLLRNDVHSSPEPFSTTFIVRRVSYWHVRPKRYRVNTNLTRSGASTSDEDSGTDARIVLDAVDSCKVVDDWLTMTHEELDWSATDLPVVAEGTIEPRVIKIFAEDCRLRLYGRNWLGKIITHVADTFLPTLNGVLDYPPHLKDLCGVLSRRTVPCQAPLLAVIAGAADISIRLHAETDWHSTQLRTMRSDPRFTCDDTHLSVPCVGRMGRGYQQSTSNLTAMAPLSHPMDLEGLHREVTHDIENVALKYLLSVWESHRAKLVRGTPPWQVPLKDSRDYHEIMTIEKRDLTFDQNFTARGQTAILDLALGSWKLQAMSQITFKATEKDALTSDFVLGRCIRTSAMELRLINLYGRAQICAEGITLTASPDEIDIVVERNGCIEWNIDPEVDMRAVLGLLLEHITLHYNSSIHPDSYDPLSACNSSAEPEPSSAAVASRNIFRLSVWNNFSFKVADGAGSVILSVKNLSIEDERTSGRFLLSTEIYGQLLSCDSCVTIIHMSDPIHLIYEASSGAIRSEFGGAQSYIDFQVAYLAHLKRIYTQAAEFVQKKTSAATPIQRSPDTVRLYSSLGGSPSDAETDNGEAFNLNIALLCRGLTIMSTNCRWTMDTCTAGMDLTDFHSAHLEVQDANLFLHDGGLCVLHWSIEELAYLYEEDSKCHDARLINSTCSVYLPLVVWCLRPLIYGMGFVMRGEKDHDTSNIQQSTSPTVSSHTLSTDDMEGASFSRVTSRTADNPSTGLWGGSLDHQPIRIQIVEPMLKVSPKPLGIPEDLREIGQPPEMGMPGCFSSAADAIYCKLLNLVRPPGGKLSPQDGWWARVNEVGIIVTKKTEQMMQPCGREELELIQSSFEFHMDQLVILRSCLGAQSRSQKKEWKALRRYFRDLERNCDMERVIRQVVRLSASYKEVVLERGMKIRCLDVPKLIVALNPQDYHYLMGSAKRVKEICEGIVGWRGTSTRKRGEQPCQEESICFAATLSQGSITLETAVSLSFQSKIISVTDAIESFDGDAPTRSKIDRISAEQSSTRHILKCLLNEARAHLDYNTMAPRTTRHCIEIGDMLVNSNSDALLRKKGDDCARVLAPLTTGANGSDLGPVFRWTALSTTLNKRTVRAATGGKKTRRSRMFHSKSKNDLLKPDPSKTTFPLFTDYDRGCSGEYNRGTIEVYEFMRIAFHPLSLNLSQKFLVEVTAFFSAASIDEDEAAEQERRKILESWQAAEAQLLGDAAGESSSPPDSNGAVVVPDLESRKVRVGKEGANPVWVKELQVQAQRFQFSYTGMLTIEDASIHLPLIDLSEVESSSLTELLGAELSWYILKAIVTQALRNKVKGMVRWNTSRKLRVLMEDNDEKKERRFSRSKIDTSEDFLSKILLASNASRRKTWQVSSSVNEYGEWREPPVMRGSFFGRVARSFSSADR